MILSTFKESASRLHDWLDNFALPLWATAGVDHANGGFFERLNLDGTPMLLDNRRARVQPRQTYCFAAAGLRGWNGNWQEICANGLEYFDRVFLKKNGFYGSLSSPEGILIDQDFDLYNQAFALFAFAQIAIAVPQKREQMEVKAKALLAILLDDYKHPVAGFQEASPPRDPLCSNPHMHLFEAFLAWEQVDYSTGPWSQLADEIANLAMECFIDRKTGAILEFFDYEWRQYPGDLGRTVEPGHLFEWAWLLVRWGSMRDNPQAIAKAKAMFKIGVDHGMQHGRDVVMMGLNDDFSPRDTVARLWPQTEWLKAASLLALNSSGGEREQYLQSAIKAITAFEAFLNTETKGLWRDKLTDHGKWIIEAAPASTFYHILCAIYEINDVSRKL